MITTVCCTNRYSSHIIIKTRSMAVSSRFQVLGGALAAFAPGSFQQVNYDMMDAALSTIHSFVPEGSKVRQVRIGCAVWCFVCSFATLLQ